MATGAAARNSDVEAKTVAFWAAAFDLWTVCSDKGISNTVAQTFITSAQGLLATGASAAPANPNTAI